jgi:hypothetical protein
VEEEALAGWGWGCVVVAPKEVKSKRESKFLTTYTN